MTDTKAETIAFTEPAIAHIEAQLAKSNASILRLSIKTTGCSGYSYEVSLLKEALPEDMLLSLSLPFQVTLMPKYLELWQNVTIDLIEENKMGLKQKRLVFINPQESGRCGCGESFHVDKKGDAHA